MMKNVLKKAIGSVMVCMFLVGASGCSIGKKQVDKTLKYHITVDGEKLDLSLYGVTYSCDFMYPPVEKAQDIEAYIYIRDLDYFEHLVEEKTKDTDKIKFNSYSAEGSDKDKPIYGADVTRNGEKVSSLKLINTDMKRSEINGAYVPLKSLTGFGFGLSEVK